METLLTYLKYGAVFSGIYIQIFLVFTYLGWGQDSDEVEELVWRKDQLLSVGIIVPAFNEEIGVVRTIESLLSSNFPHDKLEIIVVNDGSTDNTWNIIQQYSNNPRVKLFTKENGGKYTALNLGLGKTQADIVGCLDADSTVDPDAILNSVTYFLNDKEVFAVVPTMTVDKPKTLIQLIQKVEFEGALYMREVFSKLNSLFVAPGPLTLFRKEVFEKLGPYKHAYLGEDLEIAVRMQFNKMKIIYGKKVKVYTFGMKTLKTLLKQRVRWTYSFLMNMKDYRQMLFNPKHGHLGFFVFPIALLGIVLAVVLTPLITYQLIKSIWNFTEPIFYGVYPSFHFDTFYVSPNALTILAVVALGFALFAIFIGRSLNKQKIFSLDLATLIIYPFVSMIWMVKTIWKIVRSEEVTWR